VRGIALFTIDRQGLNLFYEAYLTMFAVLIAIATAGYSPCGPEPLHRQGKRVGLSSVLDFATLQVARCRDRDGSLCQTFMVTSAGIEISSRNRLKAHVNFLELPSSASKVSRRPASCHYLKKPISNILRGLNDSKSHVDTKAHWSGQDTPRKPWPPDHPMTDEQQNGSNISGIRKSWP